MAAKNQTPVFPSAFKFGFFAGLGFFFASFLMSGIGFILIAVFGLGMTGAVGALLHSSGSTQVSQPKDTRWAPPASAVRAEPTEQR